MTTIRIQKTERDNRNIVILELVELTGETFFHIHGRESSDNFDHRISTDETNWPCQRAQDLYDYYVDLFRKS